MDQPKKEEKIIPNCKPESKPRSKKLMKEIILGKKTIKALPENFYERLLNLELKLTIDFSMETLNEIIYLYSIAIEFYQSRDDIKGRDFQSRMGNLLSQPHILKKMNEHFLRSNPNSRFCSFEGNTIAIGRPDLEKEKTDIKKKVEYLSQLSNPTAVNDNVSQILNTFESTIEGAQNANSLLSAELSKQECNFKQKWEQKRAKSIFANEKKSLKLRSSKNIEGAKVRSSGFLKVSVEGPSQPQPQSQVKRGDGNTNTNTNNTYTMPLIQIVPPEEVQLEGRDGLPGEKIEFKMIEENGSLNCDDNSYQQAEQVQVVSSDEEDSVQGQEEEEEEDEENVDLENIRKDQLALLNNLLSLSPFKPNVSADEMKCESPKKSNREMISTLFQKNDNIIESKHIGPKHQKEFLLIKEKLDEYVNEFNIYFYDNFFRKSAEEIQRLMDEKYKNYIEVSKHYRSQIKEMDFLITGDSEDPHQDEIKAIVDSLKEEQENELERIQDHYNQLIANVLSSFKNIGFKSNPGVDLIEEKLKLETYNLINGILIPQKKTVGNLS